MKFEVLIFNRFPINLKVVRRKVIEAKTPKKAEKKLYKKFRQFVIVRGFKE